MEENNNSDKLEKNLEENSLVEDLKTNLNNSLKNASSIIKKTIETINENINDAMIRKEATDHINVVIQDFNNLLNDLDLDTSIGTFKANYEEE